MKSRGSPGRQPKWQAHWLFAVKEGAGGQGLDSYVPANLPLFLTIKITIMETEVLHSDTDFLCKKSNFGLICFPIKFGSN